MRDLGKNMALNLNSVAEGRVDGDDANVVTEALFQTSGLIKVQDFSIAALAETPAPQQPTANAAPAGPGGSRPAARKASPAADTTSDAAPEEDSAAQNDSDSAETKA